MIRGFDLIKDGVETGYCRACKHANRLYYLGDKHKGGGIGQCYAFNTSAITVIAQLRFASVPIIQQMIKLIASIAELL